MTRILLLSLLLGASAAATADDPRIVPEVTTTVTVSNRDVNRINCPAGIGDVFWSKERPVEVTPTATEVFVKYLVRREGGVETLQTAPVDLHIVCGGQVYTLILRPRETDSVTLRLGDEVQKQLAETAHEWSGLAVEDKVKKFTLAVYTSQLPTSFTRRVIPPGDPRFHVNAYTDLDISCPTEIIAPGTGLKATECTLSSSKPMALSEKDFLLADLGDLVAVTVDPLRSIPGYPSRLIVIARSFGNVP